MARSKRRKSSPASDNRADDEEEPEATDEEEETLEEAASRSKKSKRVHWTGYDSNEEEPHDIGSLLHRLTGVSKPVTRLLLKSGWSSTGTIALLEDSDIDETCRNLRKPGGTSKCHAISPLPPRLLRWLIASATTS